MYTESQRSRYRSEERTQPGEGREEHPAPHGSTCYACGGYVDAKGMAMGGEVADESERSEFVGDETPNDRGETSQQTQTDDMTSRARTRRFVRAVRGSR